MKTDEFCKYLLVFLIAIVSGVLSTPGDYHYEIGSNLSEVLITGIYGAIIVVIALLILGVVKEDKK